MSKVDSMIEAWAKGRAGSVRASVDTPLAGFEGFSLTPPTKQAEAPPATPLDAAPVVKIKTAPEPDIEPAAGLPEGWMPPVVLKCGHMNWPHHGTDEDDGKQVAAREGGHCCAAYAEAFASHRRLNPGVGGRAPVTVQWRVRGLHTPVPMGLRRTKEREAGPGFTGLCCHPKTGLYIGGVGNDCRFHKGKARCESHARGK